MPAYESARFLGGSPDRARLLARLAERPGSPRDLADDLPVAHRSVQRNLAKLVERGWTTKRDGAYRLTTTGAVVAARHAEYVETLDLIDRFAPLYDHLPDAEHAPDPGLLRDATLVVAGPDRPQAPVNHYVNTVGSVATRRVRMIAPVLSRLYHEAHAKLVLGGVETELVMAAETIDSARSLNPAEFRFVLGVDRFSLFEHEGPIRFGLTLGEERALLGAYDDEGGLRALLDCADPAFLAWAGTLYGRYRGAADPVTR